MVKVFLSSTSQDLGAYRQKALEVCQRFDLQPIAGEYFEAIEEGSAHDRLHKVDEAELYIGIFAHHYGDIEAGYKKSVTELEFDRAGEKGQDRLCFIVDPAYPWTPETIDYENWQSLQAFKQRIDKYQIRALFTTVDDLGVKLTQALVKWQQHQGIYTPINPPARPPHIVLAPPRPGLLIGRDDDLKTLRSYLHQERSDNPITIVSGLPGVGKTTLLTSLAYDAMLADDFPDGVLWASVGPKPDLLAELQQWAVALDVDQPGKTLDEVIRVLKGLLATRRMLLIADDVCSAEHALHFRRLMGPHCAVLITTREDEIDRTLSETREDRIYDLKQLPDDQALALLRRLAPSVAARFPAESLQLIQDLAGLSLAIRVAGRLLDSEVRLREDIRDVFEAFHQGSLRDETVIDRKAALDGVLDQSTRRLEPEMRYCYAMLGTLAPQPAAFTLEAMQHLWAVPDPMPIVRVLIDRGLLEPLPSIGRFQMHAVLVMHAKQLLNDEAALTAPALQIGNETKQAAVEYPPLNPLVDGDTPEPYRGMYVKDLKIKLKNLQRRRWRGEDTSASIDQILHEMQRLGVKPEET